MICAIRVWSVQFNLFHDQLVLSASSDSQVLLTRVASIASEPLHHLVEEGDSNPEDRWVKANGCADTTLLTLVHVQ